MSNEVTVLSSVEPQWLTLAEIEANLPPWRTDYEHTSAELEKIGVHPKDGEDGWECVGHRRVLNGNKTITCKCWRQRRVTA